MNNVVISDEDYVAVQVSDTVVNVSIAENPITVTVNDDSTPQLHAHLVDLDNPHEVTTTQIGAVPYTGALQDVDLGTNSLTTESVLFNTAPTVTPTVGQMYWDDADKTVAVTLDTVHPVNLQFGQEQHVRCVNKTGTTIADGSVVYINAAQGNRPTIALADASDVSKCQVIGIATQSIDDNAEGYVTTTGIVNNFNTSTYTDGANL